MDFLLLYLHDDDLFIEPLCSFMRLLSIRETSLSFSVEANAIITQHKTFARMKVIDNDLNLVLKSIRGKPVRQFPAFLCLDKDEDKLSIVTAVYYLDDIKASDMDILIQ